MIGVEDVVEQVRVEMSAEGLIVEETILCTSKEASANRTSGGRFSIVRERRRIRAHVLTRLGAIERMQVFHVTVLDSLLSSLEAKVGGHGAIERSSRC